jgi:DNA-binding NarL/FixJ family response regulator
MNHTIAIVDDHLLIAKALTGIIDDFKQFEVLYEVEHGAALVEKFKKPKNIPDIVLLDISMPVMDGFETALWLKQHHPGVLILTLSMQNDDPSLIKMIKCGAKGYLLKNVHPLELEKALDSLVAKGFYYPDWATTKVLMNIAEEDSAKNAVKLSERETEFLQYACTELTYREMAEKMFCSPRTVEGYRDGLFERLGLKTRVGLVVFAIKNSIVKI